MNLKNIKSLNDRDLLARTEEIAARERRLTVELLYHLREIDNRRVFCDLKCSSLLEYAVRFLKYSEDQACRRISAMRLMRDLPALAAESIGEKLESGELTVTNLGLAQSLFNHERIMGRDLTSEQKIEVIGRFCGLPKREAERIASEISPGFKATKSFTYESVPDLGLREKLRRVQGKFVHSHSHLSLPDLLHLLCDRELSAPARMKRDTREIFFRDGRKCSHCGSTYALQIDHIIPRAAGGTDAPENLRVLCRKCNQRAAIKFFGQDKMDKHLAGVK